MFNFNEVKEDYEQVELVYIRDTKAEWKNFNVNLTKGGKRSKIGIYAVSYPDNLYIDGLKITQNYKAGESFLDPFAFERFIEGFSTDITVPAKANGTDVYHMAQSVKQRSLNICILPSENTANGLKCHLLQRKSPRALKIYQ